MSRNPGEDEPDAVAGLPELIDAHRSRLSALLADIPDSGSGCRRGGGARAGTGTSSFIEDWDYAEPYRPPREETLDEGPAEEPEDTGTEPASEE
ncbi:hypothetical protein [Streptomyces sp. Inha503]|uniref:hypothetical protein n=1 Tax=Streptomyces sp. Inha503 TaxID=3383314 RepID=UPI0039A0EAA7